MTRNTLGTNEGMQTPEMRCNGVQARTQICHEVQGYEQFPDFVTVLEKKQVVREGLEPPTKGL